MKPKEIPFIGSRQLLSITERIRKDDTHAIWNGYCKKVCGEKVPIVQVNKKRVYVHRIMWEIANGSSEGVVLKKICGAERCVEPSHYWVK